MYNKLVHKEARLALVGLGYVGLPIALEFAKKISVIGFDINEERLTMMRQGIDPCKELGSEAFENAVIEFTSSIDDLRKASFFIVAVPTPIDDHNQPDLTPLLGATRSVAKALKKGDYVVYESTVYPGCTEEDCIPVLEEISGLKAGVDFKFGYSPERINPGEKVHTLPNTVKIVSGCDPEALDTIAKVYELVVKPGVHRAPNVKVAEAAKIIENTQRDVNIALMNELSIIFSRIGINTYDLQMLTGHVVRNKPLLNIKPELLELDPAGVTCANCAVVTLDKTLTPEEIVAKLRLNCCAIVRCTAAQEAAAAAVAVNVAQIKVTDAVKEEKDPDTLCRTGVELTL